MNSKTSKRVILVATTVVLALVGYKFLFGSGIVAPSLPAPIKDFVNSLSDSNKDKNAEGINEMYSEFSWLEFNKVTIPILITGVVVFSLIIGYGYKKGWINPRRDPESIVGYSLFQSIGRVDDDNESIAMNINELNRQNSDNVESDIKDHTEPKPVFTQSNKLSQQSNNVNNSNGNSKGRRKSKSRRSRRDNQD